MLLSLSCYQVVINLYWHTKLWSPQLLYWLVTWLVVPIQTCYLPKFLPHYTHLYGLYKVVISNFLPHYIHLYSTSATCDLLLWPIQDCYLWLLTPLQAPSRHVPWLTAQLVTSLVFDFAQLLPTCIVITKLLPPTSYLTTLTCSGPYQVVTHFYWPLTSCYPPVWPLQTCYLRVVTSVVWWLQKCYPWLTCDPCNLLLTGHLTSSLGSAKLLPTCMPHTNLLSPSCCCLVVSIQECYLRVAV